MNIVDTRVRKYAIVSTDIGEFRVWAHSYSMDLWDNDLMDWIYFDTVIDERARNALIEAARNAFEEM